MTGIELIAEEKERQLRERDVLSMNELWNNGELQLAAATYCMKEHASPINIDASGNAGIFISIKRTMFWPWHQKRAWNSVDLHFKPADKVKELITAGAFIAAEIDRLNNL